MLDLEALGSTKIMAHRRVLHDIHKDWYNSTSSMIAGTFCKQSPFCAYIVHVYAYTYIR